MPEWLPFLVLGLSALGAAALALIEFKRVHDNEWSSERDRITALRLINGEGAEVRTMRRSG